MEAHLSDRVCICCCQKRQWLKPPGLMAYICWIVSFHIKLNHCQTLFQHTLPYQQVHLHRSLLTLSFQDPCYFYRQKACQTVHVSYSQAWSKEHGVPGLGRVPQTPASALTTSLHCLAKGWGPALMYMAEEYWCCFGSITKQTHKKYTLNNKFGPMKHFHQYYNLAAPDCSVTVPLQYQLSL